MPEMFWLLPHLASDHLISTQHQLVTGQLVPPVTLILVTRPPDRSDHLCVAKNLAFDLNKAFLTTYKYFLLKHMEY